MIVPPVIALILPLALDTFAVSAAVGLTNPTRRQRLRLSILFAIFEGGTPAVGVLVGGPLGQALGATADYVAIAILIGFGAYTLLGKGREDEEGASRMGTAHGPALILIGLSVSLDELAIGFSIGLLGAPILPILVAIGGQAFVAAQLGFWLGRSLLRGSATWPSEWPGSPSSRSARSFWPSISCRADDRSEKATPMATAEYHRCRPAQREVGRLIRTTLPLRCAIRAVGLPSPGLSGLAEIARRGGRDDRP